MVYYNKSRKERKRQIKDYFIVINQHESVDNIAL